jgi:hypothetical protein
MKGMYGMGLWETTWKLAILTPIWIVFVYGLCWLYAGGITNLLWFL